MQYSCDEKQTTFNYALRLEQRNTEKKLFHRKIVSLVF